MPGFSSEQLTSLHLFRVAAQQVRDASAIESGAKVSFRAVFAAGEEGQEHANLIPNEAFRSLAMSVRLVYQRKSKSNFAKVCGILRRHLTEPQRSALAAIHATYDAVLDESEVVFEGPVDGESRAFTFRDAFDTWINGDAFHLEPAQRPSHEALARVGRYFTFTLQRMTLQLAGRILDLDDLVADALAEPRLPRIGRPRN